MARSCGLVQGFPTWKTRPLRGVTQSIKSVISVVHLYQWGDPIEVRWGAEAKRLGTPGLVVRAEGSGSRDREFESHCMLDGCKRYDRKEKEQR